MMISATAGAFRATSHVQRFSPPSSADEKPHAADLLWVAAEVGCVLAVSGLLNWVAA